jgi:hypothetical protein
MNVNLLVCCLVGSIVLASCQSAEIVQAPPATPIYIALPPQGAAEDTLSREREAMMMPHMDVIDDYVFKYGYTSFDLQAPVMRNDAFLEIYKNDSLIYTDSFPAEGYISMDTLGYHNVSGNKFFFALKHGFNACDYTQSSRYYFVAPEGNAFYLSEYNTFCGGDGYSCIGFEHFFPAEKNYSKDAITIVEKITYNERDQHDLVDTTSICFTGNAFNISKLTHHLDNREQDF